MRLSASTPVLLSLATTVLAQGSIGGDQSSCSPSQDWISRGCYDDTQNGRHAGFTWQLSNIIGSERYYPGFTSLLTVDICLRACRGHGFRYAAIYYGKQCFCAATFPNPGPPASGTTTTGIGACEGTKPGIPGGVCSTACNGNIMQICGGHSAASLYEDPSFTNSTSVQAASNYGYLGCFSYLNPGPTYAVIRTVSTQSCLAYCGLLNYPFASRSGPDGNAGATTCGCGTEIQSGLQVADNRCATACDGVSTVAGGPSACGGNGRQSVFVNKGLLGCYSPKIPGFDALTGYLAPPSAGQLLPGVGSASSSARNPQSQSSSTSSAGAASSSVGNPTSRSFSTGSTTTLVTYTVFPSITSSTIPQTSISSNLNPGLESTITSAIAGTLTFTNGIYTATTVCETTSVYVTTTQFSTIMTVSNVVTTLTISQTITVTTIIPTTTTTTYTLVPGGSTDSSGSTITGTSTGPSQTGTGSTTDTSTATSTGSSGSVRPSASTGSGTSGTGSATGTNTGTAIGPSGSGTGSAAGTDTGTATGPFGSGTGSATGTNTGTATGPFGSGTGSANGTDIRTVTGPAGSDTGSATGTNIGTATGPSGSGTGSAAGTNTGTATGPSGIGTGSATGTNTGTATGPSGTGTGSTTGANTVLNPSTGTGQPRTGTESDTGTFPTGIGTSSNTGTFPGSTGTSGTVSVTNTTAAPSPTLITTTGTSTIITTIGTSLPNTTGTLTLPPNCPSSCVLTITATVTVSVNLIPIRKARRFF